MAKKMYFQVSPEKFRMYDRISREGEVKFRHAETFDVSDAFYNKLIFVAKQKKNLKGRITVKEQVTGTKFILKVIQKDKGPIIVLYSNKLELRTSERNGVLLDDAKLTNEQAAGFYYSFRPQLTADKSKNERIIEEAKGRKTEYVENVVGFFADAKVAVKNYRNDIDMQDRDIQRSLQKLSRKVR